MSETWFTFKKNEGVKALSQDKKVGRPAVQPKEVRNKHVSAYLTDDEYNRLVTKLDGRPTSSMVRKLILKYIEDEH